LPLALSLKIFDSGLIKSAPAGAPGEVTSINEEGFTVACRDGSIMVKRVQPAGSGKISAADFIKNVNLRKGDRLG